MSTLDMFKLDDKVVIVTGASSGLGVAFAQAFAEAGGNVALGARRVDKMAATAALVSAPSLGRWPIMRSNARSNSSANAPAFMFSNTGCERI